MERTSKNFMKNDFEEIVLVGLSLVKGNREGATYMGASTIQFLDSRKTLH